MAITSGITRRAPCLSATLGAVAGRPTPADVGGYILRWIRRWGDREFDTVAPTFPATDSFNAGMRAAMPDTV